MSLVLRGIIPPLVMPLTEEGELDEKGLERLIEHLISGGVHGIFPLGYNGEAPSLTYELRKELISKSCNLIAKRVPVLVVITDHGAMIKKVKKSVSKKTLTIPREIILSSFKIISD